MTRTRTKNADHPQRQSISQSKERASAMLLARHLAKLEAVSALDVGGEGVGAATKEVSTIINRRRDRIYVSGISLGEEAVESNADPSISSAFRDRNAGSVSNRGKPTDDGLRDDRHRGGRNAGFEGRGGRAGRGDRGPRRGGDRHTRGPPKYVINLHTTKQLCLRFQAIRLTLFLPC